MKTYKPGDRVRIKKNLDELDDVEGITIEADMHRGAGTERVVTKVCNNDYYKLENTSGWFWHGSWLEPANTKTTSATKTMTIYTDATYSHEDGTITIDGETKTKEEWHEYQKLIRRVIERKV